MGENLPLHATMAETTVIADRVHSTLTALAMGLLHTYPDMDHGIMLLEVAHAARRWSIGALGGVDEGRDAPLYTDAAEFEAKGTPVDPIEPRTVFAKGTGLTEMCGHPVVEPAGIGDGPKVWADLVERCKRGNGI